MERYEFIRKADRSLLRAKVEPVPVNPPPPDPEPTCYGLWLRKTKPTRQSKPPSRTSSSPQSKTLFFNNPQNTGTIIPKDESQMIGYSSNIPKREAPTQEPAGCSAASVERVLDATSEFPSNKQNEQTQTYFAFPDQKEQLKHKRKTVEVLKSVHSQRGAGSEARDIETTEVLWHCDEGDYILKRYYSGPFPDYLRYGFYRYFGTEPRGANLKQLVSE